MEICPVCRKATAPLFLWRFDDANGLCLECFHKMPEKEQKYHESHLRGESKAAPFIWKAVGSLVLVAAIVVGSICLFYRPHPTPVAKKNEENSGKLAANKGAHKGGGAGGEGGGIDDADKGDGGDDPSKDDKSADGAKDGKKKDGGATIATSGRKGDDQQHLAPTVQAVAAMLPVKKGGGKNGGKDEAQPPSPVVDLINKAQDAADAIHQRVAGPGVGPGAGADGKAAIKPTSETKEKAQKTKDAVLDVATAIIEKHDQDGTKTAELLGRIGQVSTTFADVATKMTEGVAPAGKPAAGGGSSGGSTRLEADVLAAQGHSGYDPVAAVERELAEEAGAAQKKTIGTDIDPRTGQKLSGAQNPPGVSAALARGVSVPPVPAPVFRAETQIPPTPSSDGSNSGVVQDATALAMASLPAAFATAATRGVNGALVTDDGSAVSGTATGGAGSTDPMRGGRLSVVVLSMRGDLLFDFNSAALRAEAAAALREVAGVLAQRPDLPVLVRGYTDGKGTPEANLAMSKKRAEAVRDWLISKTGTKAQNITIQGLGASDPVAANQNADGSDNPAGREKNRRVTVTIPQVQAQQSTVKL
jgi:outer membrane protein OmpA-like peptidoglycan-associated protein